MSTQRMERTVINSFKLLHSIGRPLGLSCYTLPSVHEKLVIKVSPFDVVRLISLFLSHCYLTYYNFYFWQAVSTSHKMDTIFNQGIKIITTVYLLITNIGMIVVFVMREQVWSFVVDLQELATEVKLG